MCIFWTFAKLLVSPEKAPFLSPSPHMCPESTFRVVPPTCLRYSSTNPYLVFMVKVRPPRALAPSPSRGSRLPRVCA